MSAPWHIAPRPGGTRANAPDAVGEGISRHGPEAEEARAPAREGVTRTMAQLAGTEEARTVALPPAGSDDITALAARWLRAKPDAALAWQAEELTGGIPGAAHWLDPPRGRRPRLPQGPRPGRAERR